MPRAADGSHKAPRLNAVNFVAGAHNDESISPDLHDHDLDLLEDYDYALDVLEPPHEPTVAGDDTPPELYSGSGMHNHGSQSQSRAQRCRSVHDNGEEA